MAFWVGHFKRLESRTAMSSWRFNRDLAIRENMTRLRLMLENADIIDSVTVEIDPMSDYLCLVRCCFGDKWIQFRYSVYDLEEDSQVDIFYKEIIDTINTDKEDGSRRE
jgi:hypothetical protein